MKLILSLVFAAGVMFVGVPSSSAMVAPQPLTPHSHAVGLLEARDGCGPGYYRNRWGHCRPDYDRGYRDRDHYRDRDRWRDRDRYRDRDRDRDRGRDRDRDDHGRR